MSVLLKDQWVYVFGPFALDPARRVLTRADAPLSLPTKAFDLLLYLVENPDRVVSKDELFKAIWPGRIVEESNLSQTVFILRKILGTTDNGESIVVTAAGRGYRIDVRVNAVARTSAPASSEPLVALASLAAANAPALSADSSRGHERRALPPSAKRWLGVAAVSTALLGAVAIVKMRRTLPDDATQPRVLVLADFENATGDAAFDGVLARVLEIDLNQSPFLGILPKRKAQETLQQMGYAKGDKLTPALAQEICQRNQAHAAISGALAAVGNRYVVTLSAADCASGAAISEGKTEVSSKEGVIASLDELTAKIRAGVGESRASIQKFGIPIAQATTPSFEALKAFSLGEQARATGDNQAAIGFHKHAVELDPSFAMAYLDLGTINRSLHETVIGNAYLKKAFELRDRVSEHEKVRIAATYQMSQNNTKALIQSYKSWTQAYPQDWQPWANLTNLYTDSAQYTDAVDAGRKALKLMPEHGGVYYVLARAYSRMNDQDQAKAVCAQAMAKGLDGSDIRGLLYEIAYIDGDTARMTELAAKEMGQPSEYLMLHTEGFVAATSGKIQQARSLFERAIDEARESGPDSSAEVAGFYVDEIDVLVNSGLNEQAAQLAAKASGLESNEFASTVIAKMGDVGRAESLVDELFKRNLVDSVINEDDIPVTRATIDLRKGRPLDAIAELQPALRYELRNFELPSLLGHAYLDAKMPDRAAAEYRKILANRGVDAISMLYPLAYLGLARAEAQLGDKASSRADYEKFFAFWKDADADLPVLVQARQEYASRIER